MFPVTLPANVLSKITASGWNRAPGVSLLAADNDVQAVTIWLREYEDSPLTQLNYRKEAERFLLWAAQTCGKPLSALSREDIQDYERFLASPCADWCGPAKPRFLKLPNGKSVPNPDWRPFTGPLSLASRKQSLTILGSLCRYLCNAGYLLRNPFSLQRSRNTKGIVQIHDDRWLDHAAFTWLSNWIEMMPRESPIDAAHAERARWIIALLYHSAARRAEIAKANMNDIYEKRGKWWLRVTGKGQKSRDIPVSDTLLDALRRYRHSLRLSALPGANEETPLICAVNSGIKRNRLRPIGDHCVYKTVRVLLQRASESAQKAELPQVASQLAKASTHWLRHTAASHQLNAGVPLLMVSQNLGHAAIETTRKYLHTEDDDRHNATVKSAAATPHSDRLTKPIFGTS
ncbi:tyrosine-type recombinase/integrase [Laribacter hongkongensis]|uniref:tyrosine-type recombinase/integrase n=1 Tax=Laribacter hongkongensis TaxID=168471 RepID=UPI001EFCA60D|nr:site-specific integrase [Laribacter hongkongensis]MCG9084282.1 tyrosine-type recombinase/integrase [Laribacter hongkongensis]